MRLGEQLRRTLAEARNLRLGSLAQHGIGDLLEIHGSFVRQVVKDVLGLDGVRATLLVSKDQIDPVVKMQRNILALERHSLDTNKLLGRALGPRRKRHIIDRHAILHLSQVEFVTVLEELRIVVEFYVTTSSIS